MKKQLFGNSEQLRLKNLGGDNYWKELLDRIYSGVQAGCY